MLLHGILIPRLWIGLYLQIIAFKDSILVIIGFSVFRNGFNLQLSLHLVAFSMGLWHLGKKWDIYGWWFYDHKRSTTRREAYNYCRWRYFSCHGPFFQNLRIVLCLFSFSHLGLLIWGFVEIALETLVENRITGFPVIDDNWKLVKQLLFCWDYSLLKCIYWWIWISVFRFVG